MPLILLAFGHCELRAQQSWPQNSPYNGQYNTQPYSSQYDRQYAPPPNNAYGQPYGQPGNAPMYGNPQQPYDSTQQYPQQDYAPSQPQSPTAQPLNTEQLEQLVAPIALYPDTLVAQVLAAATYPAQVVDADHWRQAQGNAPPDDIVAGANAQSWDPSLKALTAFPQVLAEMDQNLRWTIALGNAYYNQPQDVLDVIQVMRQRAQAAGNLQSTPQESVSYDQGYIQLAPANPQVVYLPAYDPWNAYGQPIEPYRGFSLTGALGSIFGSLSGSGAVQYGLGIAMSAFSRTPWGWLGWGLDWLSHSLLFQNSNYYSRSTTVADWGFPHGGPRARFQSSFRRETLDARAGANGYRQNQPYDRDRSYQRDSFNHQEFNHQALNRQDRYARPSDRYDGHEGYNRSPGYPQEPQRFAENRRPQEGPRNYPDPRAYPDPRTNYSRPQPEAYNRIQPPRNTFNTPPSYTRPAPGYGSGYYNRSEGGRYNPRPEMAYANPMPYRPSTGNYPREEPRGGFQNHFSGFYDGRGFSGYSGKQPKSGGGFHLFGGGHDHAPKGFGGGKGFGGHHSDGGGHSHGHGGGGHHR